MSAEEIIRAWKAEDDEEKNENAPANPAGEELSDEELGNVEGGTDEPGSGAKNCSSNCGTSCNGLGGGDSGLQ